MDDVCSEHELQVLVRKIWQSGLPVETQQKIATPLVFWDRGMVTYTRALNDLKTLRTLRNGYPEAPLIDEAIEFLKAN